MTSCPYKYYYHASSWGCGIYFFKKSTYGKNHSCKVATVAVFPFHQVSLSSQMFSGMFFVWMPFQLYLEKNNIFINSVVKVY